MLAFYSILFNKRALLLYVKGKSTPIALEAYPSIYSSLMIEKFKKAPVNFKDIILKSGEEKVEGSGSKNISGTKLYMAEDGKI